MSKTINLQGTSLPYFRIGISGPTVYFGTGFPDAVGNPAPIADGLKNGDLYVRTDSPNQGMFQFDSVGGTWALFAGTGGGSSVFTGDVQVQGDLETGGIIIDINSLEAGSGISHPDGVGGIAIGRGTLDAARWIFDEANDWWQPDSLDVAANNIFVPGNLLVGTGGLTIQTGGAGAPSLHFAGDPTTGIYSPSPGFIGITNGGTLTWSINASGDLMPAASQNIGSTGAPAGNTYSQRVLHGDGIAPLPSITFLNDDDTGMYLSNPNEISFANSGNQSLVIGSGGILSVQAGYEAFVLADTNIPNKKYVDDAVSAATVNYPLQGPNGSQAAPTYSFSSGTNVGMYFDGANLSFSTTGTGRMFIEASGVISVPPGYEALAISDTHIPNNKRVDDRISLIPWKNPVLVRDDTVHANLIAAEAAMNSTVVDGVTVSTGDRILYTGIAGEPDDIYVIVGVPGSGATLAAVTPSSIQGSGTYIIDGTQAGKVAHLDENSVWTNTGGIANLSEDTTPQLGADLDLAGFDIFSSSVTQIDIKGYDGGTTGGSMWIRAGNGTIAGGNLSFSPGRDSTDESFNGYIQIIPQDLNGPVPEFRMKDSQQADYVGFRAPNDVSSGSTGDGSNVVWVLPEGDGTDKQHMVTNGSGVLRWESTPYDVVGQAFGTISDAQVFTIFKAVRGFVIGASGHDGYAITGPNGGNATITVNVNGSSIGTLVFNDSSGAAQSLSSETIVQTTVNAGDRVEFVLTTGNSIQDFSVTLSGSY